MGCQRLCAPFTWAPCVGVFAPARVLMLVFLPLPAAGALVPLADAFVLALPAPAARPPPFSPFGGGGGWVAASPFCTFPSLFCRLRFAVGPAAVWPPPIACAALLLLSHARSSSQLRGSPPRHRPSNSCQSVQAGGEGDQGGVTECRPVRQVRAATNRCVVVHSRFQGSGCEAIGLSMGYRHCAGPGGTKNQI